SVSAGPNQSVSAGAVAQLTNATFNDPGAPNTYTATVNWGDGSPTDTSPSIGSPATVADSGQVFDSHVYGQPGVYTVTVSVTKSGQTAVSSTFTVTVTDVAPSVNAGPDILAGPGTPVNINATFSHPSFPVNGVQETYTATINWG